MEMFKTDPEIPIFLMSLTAGNLGLNLTAANRVYIMDPWWNPATEDQATDRVYRLGQNRDVIVTRFVMKDSVEKKIMQIQERKRQLINSALAKSKESLQHDRRQEWLNDLRDLFK
ncbi:SNF2-related domain-containing protein [Reticulomyxa filosa]|uniref:SNF2-related domain-containing protein n=1 Tax=Reticulomyxa filosa TaxID=46433 RepID=X6MAV8_RETFI|nr:SNF2-related domain-containing protein [Reticulomyxa filosa]|eukprot:ETO10175.1 SNF2-related domain-containing protein [Reticulomyxa filosa]